jgi:hypothetical protein
MPRAKSLYCAVSILSLVSGAAEATLTSSVDLGRLGPGSNLLRGDTSAGANNADYYSGLSEPSGNWGNELVYQLRVTETLVASLTANTLNGDVDFFLLSGLATSSDGAKQAARDGIGVAFLNDGPGVRETVGIMVAGTYYLSADTWLGPDGALTPANASFECTLSLALPTNLGILGNNATALKINSLGSAYDTELALFDSAGRLLGINDDISTAGGVKQSELLMEALSVGDYYLALGGWNSAFGDSFSAVGGASSGSFQLNHPNGTMAGTSASGELEWFSFSIIPEPGMPTLLVFSACALLLRRRTD